MNLFLMLAQVPEYSYHPAYHWPWYLRIPLILFAIRAVVWGADAFSRNKPPTTRVPPPIPGAGRDPVINTPAVSSEKSAGGILIAGYVCAAVSLMLLPPFLGLSGVIFGIVAINRKRTNPGTVLIIVSFIFAVIGMIYGAAS